MPKVLGMEEMGNYEVLKWMRQTKERHAGEDAEAEAEGLILPPRPAALDRAFDKHERHLTRDVYPYDKNPSVHNYDYDVDTVCRKLSDLIAERIHKPILRKYQAKLHAREISKKEAEDGLEKEVELKYFTEMELMQMHNLAPNSIETLQLCIEQWDERFSEEEMQVAMKCIVEILRPDEKKARQDLGVAEEDTTVDSGAAADAEEKSGLEETGKMDGALREMSPFSARAAMTTTEVAPAGEAVPRSSFWLPVRRGAPVVPQTGGNATELGRRGARQE